MSNVRNAMACMAVLALIAGCDKYHRATRCSDLKIVSILDCSSATQRMSAGGILFGGTGVASADTISDPGKCRVELENNTRFTLERPLAVGDTVVVETTEDSKNGIVVRTSAPEIVSEYWASTWCER